MKRSAPLRRTAIRVPTQRRPQPAKIRTRSRSAAYAKLRRRVYDRARGHCERCGRRLGPVWEAHHRKLRSQGGRDEIPNLVALCLRLDGPCHSWVHANPAAARAMGWIVRSAGNPASVAVTIHDGRVVRLDPDGGYDTVFGPDGRIA